MRWFTNHMYKYVKLSCKSQIWVRKCTKQVGPSKQLLVNIGMSNTFIYFYCYITLGFILI